MRESARRSAARPRRLSGAGCRGEWNRGALRPARRAPLHARTLRVRRERFGEPSLLLWRERPAHAHRIQDSLTLTVSEPSLEARHVLPHRLLQLLQAHLSLCVRAVEEGIVR